MNQGASQAHKHLQFIPEDVDGPPIEKLAGMAHLKTEGKFEILRPIALSHVELQASRFCYLDSRSPCTLCAFLTISSPLKIGKC